MCRIFKFIDYGSAAAALKVAQEELFKEQLSRDRIRNRYRIWYGGKVVEMQTYKRNPVRLDKTFFFDVEDLDKVVSGPIWSFANPYVQGTVKGGSKLKLHRYLLDYDGELEIDHRDRNPANNSRKNIWICTHKENMNNHSLQKNNKTGENGISEGFNDGKPKYIFTWYEDGKRRSKYFERTDAGWTEAITSKKETYDRIDNKNGN